MLNQLRSTFLYVFALLNRSLSLWRAAVCLTDRGNYSRDDKTFKPKRSFNLKGASG